MLGKILGLALVVVLILGVVLFVTNNLNSRFDEFERPTGIEPSPPTWVVGILIIVLLLLAGGILTTSLEGRKGGSNSGRNKKIPR